MARCTSNIKIWSSFVTTSESNIYRARKRLEDEERGRFISLQTDIDSV